MAAGIGRVNETPPRPSPRNRLPLASPLPRDEGADILIVARTDARQAASLEEALWRAEAFAAAGADILFIDALESVEEMRAFAALGGAAAGKPKVRSGRRCVHWHSWEGQRREANGEGLLSSVHGQHTLPTHTSPPPPKKVQMANMLEGGGKTPLLSPEELQRLGFKLVAYPLSLLGVSIRAMEGALQVGVTRGWLCGWR
jgi:hypothetical protein